MQAKYIEFPKKGKIEVKEEILNVSNLGPMEVIIRNETSIISAGTELAQLNGMESNGFPFRPGYGSIGRIESIGSGVKDFKVGSRVFYAGKHASLQRFIHGEPHQWGYLFPVPEDMDPIEASVGCMAEIAMTACNITQLKMNDTVVVFGLGMVGILAGLMYKSMGARVIGVDPVNERCLLAKKAGIDIVVSDNYLEKIMEHTNGKGAEVTVDAAGSSEVICNCIEATADLGQIIILGSPRKPYNADITKAFWDIHYRGLVMRGAHMFHYPLHPERGCQMNVEWAFETVFDMIRTRKLDVRSLISHVIKVEDAEKAYQGLQNNTTEYTAVVIDWR